MQSREAEGHSGGWGRRANPVPVECRARSLGEPDGRAGVREIRQRGAVSFPRSSPDRRYLRAGRPGRTFPCPGSAEPAPRFCAGRKPESGGSGAAPGPRSLCARAAGRGTGLPDRVQCARASGIRVFAPPAQEALAPPFLKSLY